MRKTNTLVLVSMLCVLIGYFEPANAQSELLIINPDTKTTQVYPNPVVGRDMMSVSVANVAAAYVISLDGNTSFPCVVENNYQFQPLVAVDPNADPNAVVENNYQFQPLVLVDPNTGQAVVENNYQFQPIILVSFPSKQLPVLNYGTITLPDLQSGVSYFLVAKMDDGTSTSTIITMK